jgi:hypothetical protein
MDSSQDRLDYASIGKTKLLCTATQKAASSTLLQFRHVIVQGQKLLWPASSHTVLEADR